MRVILRRALDLHLGPVVLFASLAVAWTWPLVLHLHDALPGGPGDNFSFVWNLWWMRHVLATPGLSYLHTTYLFSPFGTSIADHPHTALPALVAATLLRPASPVTAQNLLLLGYVFANMATMYALVSTILAAPGDVPADAENGSFVASNGVRRGHRRAAIFAAVLFGLSPYIAVHLLGHFDLIAAWVLPLFALALRRAAGHPQSAIRNPPLNVPSAAAGLVLAATAYIAYYYVVYLWLFTVAYLLAWADWISVARSARPHTSFVRRLRGACALGGVLAAGVALAIVVRPGRSFAIGSRTVWVHEPQNALSVLWICAFGWILATWRPVVAYRAEASARLRRAGGIIWRIAAVFVAGTAPLLWEGARLVLRGGYVTQQYGWRSIPRGVDLLAPLLGHPLHPLFHDVSARAYAALHQNYVEAIGWMGIIPVALLIATRREGLAAPAHDERRTWRIIAIVFGVWALGPFVTIGGFDTGLKLPEILARFVPFVENARMPGRAIVGVFMALGVLIGLPLAAATGRLRSPALLWLLIAGVAFEFWDAPIELTRLDRPAVYDALAAAGPGAVCEAPFGIGDGLSVGVGSQDRRVLYYATLHEHPLVGGYSGRMPVGAADRYRRTPVVGPLLQLSDGAPLGSSTDATASGSPCRYIVVHRAAASAAMAEYVRRLPADRIAIDTERDLYRLR
ncbi:MAG TPA: hypothetical protein VGX46_06450 [Vicinamibacterales bacterium]|nr:hypothetical protein [Vicinamibacterales bacterium]